MELCTAYRNTDLCAHQCLICFTGTISLTVFACFSDFTSITFTVNNNFPFLLPYITNSWLSAFYRERIAFLLKCFSRRLSQKLMKSTVLKENTVISVDITIILKVLLNTSDKCSDLERVFSLLEACF